MHCCSRSRCCNSGPPIPGRRHVEQQAPRIGPAVVVGLQERLRAGEGDHLIIVRRGRRAVDFNQPRHVGVVIDHIDGAAFRHRGPLQTHSRTILGCDMKMSEVIVQRNVLLFYRTRRHTTGMKESAWIADRARKRISRAETAACNVDALLDLEGKPRNCAAELRHSSLQSPAADLTRHAARSRVRVAAESVRHCRKSVGEFPSRESALRGLIGRRSD